MARRLPCLGRWRAGLRGGIHYGNANDPFDAMSPAFNSTDEMMRFPCRPRYFWRRVRRTLSCTEALSAGLLLATLKAGDGLACMA